MTAPRLRALALLSITLVHGWSVWQQRPRHAGVVPLAAVVPAPLRAAS